MPNAQNQLNANVRKSPSTINLQFAAQWSVVLPTIFRYEDKKWIDEFFGNGKLRLSTFAKFSLYEDEIRGDPEEGRGVAFGISEKQTVAIAVAEGFKAFILCGSTLLDRDLQTAFDRDSVFAIENTLGFSHAIARQLPGFRHGLEGNCIYRSNTTIHRDFSVDVEKYRLPDGNINMQMLSDIAGGLGGAERVLLKRKKYETQKEYRLLWHVDAVGADYLDINCPEAVQFCRRVEQPEF